jgi:transcription antitermination protein NusB
MGSPEEKPLNNRELSSRMLAVQAMYQILQTGAYAPDVTREYLDTRIEMDLDEGTMVRPDGALFKKIMNNLNTRMADVDEIVRGCMNKKQSEDQKTAETEPLLKSILLCGVCEILCHTDIDAPIIINDYLDVTHTFYEKSQVSLVNGIFDNARKVIREH